MLRRLKRGLYSVVDPARQVPAIAVASAARDQRPHYITTDAALSFHGMIDQPVPEIVVTVVRGSELTPFLIGSQKVRESGVSQAAFDLADHYGTTVDGYKVDIASRVQAVVDALDAPRQMIHFSLLPEVLRAFDQAEVNAVVKGAIGRSRASAQRLGFLLEDAGVPMPPGLAAIAPSAVVELRPGQRSGLFSSRWRVYA